MSGSIVFLYGPPAAGKSSLAREVLFRYRATGEPRPLLYLGTDQLRETISGRDFVGTVRPAIYDGLQVMTEVAALGDHHVLVDGNYLEERFRTPILEMAEAKGLRVLKVLVHCPVELGQRRNSARLASERVPDEYLRSVYSQVGAAREDADLVVDTRTEGGQAADRILAWLLGYTPERQADEPTAKRILEELAAQGRQRELAPGQALWTAGGCAREVILVLEGQLEVVRESPDHPAVVLNRLGPGELAGELSSLDGTAHSATLRAAVSSKVASLDADQFRALLPRHPELLQAVMHSMVARIRSLSQAAGVASLDLLTGLGNRRVLEDRLPQLWHLHQQSGEPLSLALFDVDRFKGINDGFGHQAGDVILRELGRLLREHCDEDWIPIRYGGDEFVVLMSGTDGPQARQRMEAFSQAVRNHHFQVDESLSLRATVSVGVAATPAADTEELHRRADEAAYVSKRQGRNQVNLWSAELMAAQT